MLNVLFISFVDVFVVTFMAGRANAALRHFECTGFKSNGTPCRKSLTVSTSKGYSTTCTGCRAKYTFDGENVVDEDGNVVDSY